MFSPAATLTGPPDLRAAPSGKPGRQQTLSDAAIQARPTIKVLFGLPPRQTIECIVSLLELASLGSPVAEFSTFCRCQRRLAVQLPHRGSGGPLLLLVDSTGIKAHRRSLAETRMNCVNLPGPRPACRDFERQTAELQVRSAILDRSAALGIPVTRPIGCHQTGKGKNGRQEIYATWSSRRHPKKGSSKSPSSSFRTGNRIPPSALWSAPCADGREGEDDRWREAD